MMACTSPLYRVPYGSMNFTALYPVDRQRVRNGGVFLPYEALQAYKELPGFNIDQVQRIRCGQCLDCRLHRSREWALRCTLEASMHETNYFITLTYDDLHLPRGEFVDYEGQVWESNLYRRDIQLFLKNLREYERIHFDNTDIKVFYCGEYGDQNGRPHYHLCLFNPTPIFDLSYSFSRGGYKFYKSALYERFWKSSDTGLTRGFVDISEASYDTMAYTARYCLKKQQGLMKKEFLEYYDQLTGEKPDLRMQPFVGMSTRPAIAYEYYQENKNQIRTEDLVKYEKAHQLYTSRPPAYFDKLFDRDDHDAFEDLKRKRTIAAVASAKSKALRFSEDELSRMTREASILKAKVDKYYVRDL